MVLDTGKLRKINVSGYGKLQKKQCFLVWEAPEKTMFLDMGTPKKKQCLLVWKNPEKAIIFAMGKRFGSYQKKEKLC